MANTTKELNTRWRFKGPSFTLPMAAATKIFAGALVGVNAAGNAVKGDDTAAITIKGVAGETVDNTGAAGAKRITVETGVFEFACTAAVTALADTAYATDRKLYADDDQTVGVAADTVNSIVAGWFQEFGDTTAKAWVAIGLTPHTLT